jgi:hypothetical protein
MRLGVEAGAFVAGFESESFSKRSAIDHIGCPPT